MRVFVYEYFCSGAAVAQPPSMRREGQAILSAVVEDLCRCRGVEVSSRVEQGEAGTLTWPKNLRVRVGGPQAEEKDLRELAKEANFTLLIAPECNDILATRCQWVEEVGGRLLGPSSSAVRLAADKLSLSSYLTERCVPTPRTVSWSPEAAALGFPLVVKPRDGAGSQATFLVQNVEELCDCQQVAASEGWRGELIAQPFVPGVSASVSLVTGPGGKFCLKPVWQHLSNDGRFRYLGGGLPLAPEVSAAAKTLAVKVLTAIEGLRGWCSVDVVLHPNGNQLIEINPRLTTSYIGLRRLARCNLMDLLLGAAGGQSHPLVDWSDSPVYFEPDGTVHEGKAEMLKYENPFAKNAR